MKLRRFAMAILAAALVSCGENTGKGDAPPGSTIQINPSSKPWAEEGNVGAYDLIQPFEITLLNGANNPLQDTRVQIFLDLSPGAVVPGGSEPMLLLDTLGTPVPSIFETRTDTNGNVRVYVQFVVGGGAAYSGDLQAFSGGAFQSASIEVSCIDTNDTTEVCD